MARSVEVTFKGTTETESKFYHPVQNCVVSPERDLYIDYRRGDRSFSVQFNADSWICFDSRQD